jgi:hypothetical protein
MAINDNAVVGELLVRISKKHNKFIEAKINGINSTGCKK